MTDATVPYTLKIKLHDGVDEEDDIKMEVIKGKIAQLVLTLVEGYEHKGHKLVMDNYYNSPVLFTSLKGRGIGALGTLRHNRSGLTKEQIQDNYFAQIFSGDYVYYITKEKDLMLLYFMGSA